jgi:glycosidase
MSHPIEQNQSAFPDWVPDAVFYQIFPDRFCRSHPEQDSPQLAAWSDLPTRENFFGGDLKGIQSRLDYLHDDLGVDALYLNPIFKAETNHKYDTVDYFSVDPAFGALADLRELVDECHRRGMRVILDGVFNHCGAGFPGFQDLLKNGEKSDYKDWFTSRSYPLSAQPLNYLTCGGATYLPKFNHSFRPVREFILKVARYWLDAADIDGWRLDVPFKIPADFWQEFRLVVKQADPQAYLVGEIWREADPWVRGDTFDGVTNYRLRELLLDYCLTNVLDGEDFAYETETLTRVHGPASRAMLNLLGSHDTARILTLLRGDVDRLKIALTYLMTTPGAPMIYYGDEVGLLGETDPDCRRPMPWDERRWDLCVVNIYRKLIDLRKNHPATRRGERETLFFFNGVFAYRMALGQDVIIVILNPREGIPALVVPTHSTGEVWKDSETGRAYPALDGKLDLGYLPARSATVLVRAEG